MSLLYIIFKFCASHMGHYYRVKNQKPAGTEPVNELLLKKSSLRLVLSPGHISSGTVPVKELENNSKEMRLLKSPISVGSVPVKVLVPKPIAVRLVKSPISVGSVPLKVFLYNLDN